MDRAALKQRFGIIGDSDVVRHALDRVRQVARTEITVLLQGESGVGKELFAQALHELSDRRHKPIMIVNCGAIPEGLIESELFGNEKGAYTGAVERRTGYFEEANGSTIFLDEIGELPLTAQVRLLRVLESGEFSRVGSSGVQRTNVRVIAATNKDLGKEVGAGRFREDLYYRLSTVIIQVPALRERGEDILMLFAHFQHLFAQKYNTPKRRLDESARQLLARYRWPGNVRELRNVAEQSSVLLRGDVITGNDLRPYLRGVSAGGTEMGLLPVTTGRRDTPTSGSDSRERELVYRALIELRHEIRDMREQLSSLVPDERPPVSRSDPRERALVVLRNEPDDNGLPPYIEDIPYELEGMPDASVPPVQPPSDTLPTLEAAERTLIMEALERFEGNRRQTAKALGISERTLYRKLKEQEDETS